MKKSALLLLLLVLILLAGCGGTKEAKGTGSTGTADLKMLYENEEFNVKVKETDGWKLAKANMNGNKLNAKFEKDTINAIISSLTTKKSFKIIKNELVTGAGKVEILEEKENYISFESTMKTKIRTDIYLEKQGDYTYIFTFVTPVADYKEVNNEINKLRQNILVN
ncbi:hypothetical protein BME96_01510 [Virgibacillus halodenitrificans]|uniref:PsbP C-terminal domain-containing protein n=1 Tax=Virgibacillus halodenitrificans TaxID=1482 RepID=A0AAC9IW10_VIRHA|nr:hypothetical protein [Virgibacillus halodenitrificans]APC46948.1 hypothetical protein BME96_01510 [Virgibacillus halodenitrificans]MCJ0930248.1 hypothetical protein [Virgibacillus halodenitrificans]CDQ37142.1 hypothetical protein BN993_06677 [Virgibacillus halodenitrificans]